MVLLLLKGLNVPFLLILPAVVRLEYSVMAIYAAQAISDVIATVFMVLLYKRTKDFFTEK